MCLVHENQDCIIDLVRNLNHLDPGSKIILYNGGTNADLFRYFPFEQYGAVLHPSPRPLKWGWLHDFALDCMEFAIENYEFDLITVVDSDQLAIGRNYSDFVTKAFRDNPDLGMFGQIASRIGQDTLIDPAVTAYLEKDVWESYLEKLPNGKEAFLHWTFWPSTAFSYKASVDLVRLFRTDERLKEILKSTKIWASEEILFPTLTIALGYTIVENPFSYEYVKYKSIYSDLDIKQACEKADGFWIHPVERKINDRNRVAIRNSFDNYVVATKRKTEVIDVDTHAIFQKTKHIEGWLGYDEMELLLATCSKKVATKENPVVVEIGSYCGKATAAMALATQEINSNTAIIAIDDFTGRLGAEDTRIDNYGSCFEKLQQTLNGLAIQDRVEVIQEKPYLVHFTKEIDILLIDGLHDYANVARDFYTYEKNVCPDGIILFHDYSSHFPGVVAFVDELAAKGCYQVVDLKSSLVVLKRTGIANDSIDFHTATTEKELPLVSCIMPTYNRPEFISQAVQQFLEQDYPNKELVIIDDSPVSIKVLIPDSDLIHYTYQKEKSDLGTKRNLACEKAKGEIIVHLDDDDYYAPDWLSKQVSFLTEQGLEITGLSAPVFYDKSNADVWQYIYPEKEKPWVYGATLCYTKKLWQSNPFPTVDCGEDNMFVWSSNVKKVRPHEEIESYVGQIHDSNTSPKTKNSRWHKLKKELASRILTYHRLV